MLGFEVLQLIHELIELSIRDLRIVEYVVAMFVVPDLLPQLVDFLLDVFCRRHHRGRL
jgi:hypothetical protein